MDLRDRASELRDRPPDREGRGIDSPSRSRALEGSHSASNSPSLRSNYPPPLEPRYRDKYSSDRSRDLPPHPDAGRPYRGRSPPYSGDYRSNSPPYGYSSGRYGNEPPSSSSSVADLKVPSRKLSTTSAVSSAFAEGGPSRGAPPSRSERDALLGRGASLDDRRPDDRKSDERRYDDRKLDDKRSDDRRQDDLRRNDDRRLDERRVDDRDRRSDDRRVDERRGDDRRAEDRKVDDRRIDERKADDRRPDERKSESRKAGEEKPAVFRRAEDKASDKKQDEKNVVSDASAAAPEPAVPDPPPRSESAQKKDEVAADTSNVKKKAQALASEPDEKPSSNSKESSSSQTKTAAGSTRSQASDADSSQSGKPAATSEKGKESRIPKDRPNKENPAGREEAAAKSSEASATSDSSSAAKVSAKEARSLAEKKSDVPSKENDSRGDKKSESKAAEPSKATATAAEKKLDVDQATKTAKAKTQTGEKDSKASRESQAPESRAKKEARTDSSEADAKASLKAAPVKGNDVVSAIEGTGEVDPQPSVGKSPEKEESKDKSLRPTDALKSDDLVSDAAKGAKSTSKDDSQAATDKESLKTRDALKDLKDLMKTPTAPSKKSKSLKSSLDPNMTPSTSTMLDTAMFTKASVPASSSPISKAPPPVPSFGTSTRRGSRESSRAPPASSPFSNGQDQPSRKQKSEKSKSKGEPPSSAAKSQRSEGGEERRKRASMKTPSTTGRNSELGSSVTRRERSASIESEVERMLNSVPLPEYGADDSDWIETPKKKAMLRKQAAKKAKEAEKRAAMAGTNSESPEDARKPSSRSLDAGPPSSSSKKKKSSSSTNAAAEEWKRRQIEELEKIKRLSAKTSDSALVEDKVEAGSKLKDPVADSEKSDEKRSDKSEGAEIAEKPEKTEKSDKQEKPERSDRSEKPEKPEKSEKTEKTEKTDKSDGPEKSEKSEMPSNSEKVDRSERSEKSDLKRKRDKSHRKTEAAASEHEKPESEVESSVRADDGSTVSTEEKDAQQEKSAEKVERGRSPQKSVDKLKKVEKDVDLEKADKERPVDKSPVKEKEKESAAEKPVEKTEKERSDKSKSKHASKEARSLEKEARRKEKKERKEAAKAAMALAEKADEQTSKPPKSSEVKENLSEMDVDSAKPEREPEPVTAVPSSRTTTKKSLSRMIFSDVSDSEDEVGGKNDSDKSLNASVSDLRKARVPKGLSPATGSQSPLDTGARASPALRPDTTLRVSGPTATGRKDEDGIVISGRKRAIPYSAINQADRSGRTPIFKYASFGDVETVKALIGAGADVNVRDNAGWTPLHEASLEGHRDIVELLISYGADVNSVGLDGETPLHDAVENDHYDVIDLLLTYGSHLNAKNKKGETPIDIAKKSDIVDLLRKWQTMISKVIKTDENGRSLLHTCAERGDLEGLKEAIRFGADIDFMDRSGWTPLHEGVDKGHSQITEELLRHGASVDARGGLRISKKKSRSKDEKKRAAVEDADGDSDTFESDNVTPLMVACAGLHVECVKILLEFGADGNAVSADGRKVIDFVGVCSALSPSHKRKLDFSDMTEAERKAADAAWVIQKDHAEDHEAEVRNFLSQPASYWQPYREAEFTKRKIWSATSDEMMPSLEDVSQKSGAASNAPRKSSSKHVRRNSVTSDTSMSTGTTSGVTKSLTSVSAAVAAAAGLGGPSAFSWGGLDPKDREGPFVSSREQRKFNALLKTIAANDPSASASSNSARKPKGRERSDSGDQASPPTPSIPASTAPSGTGRKRGRPPKEDPQGSVAGDESDGLAKGRPEKKAKKSEKPSSTSMRSRNAALESESEEEIEPKEKRVKSSKRSHANVEESEKSDLDNEDQAVSSAGARKKKKLADEVIESPSRTKKDRKEGKGDRENREPKESREGKDSKDGKGSRDSGKEKGSKESKDNLESKEVKESSGNKEHKDSKDADAKAKRREDRRLEKSKEKEKEKQREGSKDRRREGKGHREGSMEVEPIERPQSASPSRRPSFTTKGGSPLRPSLPVKAEETADDALVALIFSEEERGIVRPKASTPGPDEVKKTDSQTLPPPPSTPQRRSSQLRENTPVLRENSEPVEDQSRTDREGTKSPQKERPKPAPVSLLRIKEGGMSGPGSAKPPLPLSAVTPSGASPTTAGLPSALPAKKKAKKKNWLGISGYQKAGDEKLAPPPGTLDQSQTPLSARDQRDTFPTSASQQSLDTFTDDGDSSRAPSPVKGEQPPAAAAADATKSVDPPSLPPASDTIPTRVPDAVPMEVEPQMQAADVAKVEVNERSDGTPANLADASIIRDVDMPDAGPSAITGSSSDRLSSPSKQQPSLEAPPISNSDLAPSKEDSMEVDATRAPSIPAVSEADPSKATVTKKAGTLTVTVDDTQSQSSLSGPSMISPTVPIRPQSPPLRPDSKDVAVQESSGPTPSNSSANLPVQSLQAAADSKAPPTAPTMDDMQGVEVSSFKRKKCLPLYLILLPMMPGEPVKPRECRPRYVVDLQVALCLGHTSGRDVVDQYPQLTRRIATRSQKARLQASPVGEAVLAAILENRGLGSGPDAVVPRFIKWVWGYGGRKALQLVDVDIQLLDAAQVLSQVFGCTARPSEAGWALAASPMSSVITVPVLRRAKADTPADDREADELEREEIDLEAFPDLPENGSTGTRTPTTLFPGSAAVSVAASPQRPAVAPGGMSGTIVPRKRKSTAQLDPAALALASLAWSVPAPGAGPSEPPAAGPVEPAGFVRKLKNKGAAAK
ncbi:hypothetical protein HDU96_007363 [Phlyctochytrium bullatum]|nr:hypothetical protein HDU96_007363 [Phlyctochytrium bullatum]